MKWIVLPAAILICSFIIDARQKLQQASWLAGTLENKTGRGSLYEHWTKNSDTSFSGKSYMIKDKDTIVFENLQLVCNAAGMFYIPAVKNQNGGQPVPFALKQLTDTEMVFENPAHDFPQVITYTKITNDSLVATISGKKNGQERKQVFPMRRIN